MGGILRNPERTALVDLVASGVVLVTRPARRVWVLPIFQGDAGCPASDLAGAPDFLGPQSRFSPALHGVLEAFLEAAVWA